MNAEDLPTPATLRKLLSYDPATGLLTWHRRPIEMFTSERIYNSWNTKHAGKEAFTAVTHEGYRSGRIFRKFYSAHRVAWAIHHGAWPIRQIDHINGSKSDNRIANLRDVSPSTNQRNAVRPSNNTSGVCGVSWHKGDRTWQAQITLRGKRRHIGRFADFNDAVAARKAAEVKYGFHPNHGRSAPV